MSDKPRLNVLLLIPNVGFGGAERVFSDHSREFSSYYNVIECVFNEEGNRVYSTSNQLVSLDVPGGGNILFKLYYFLLRCIRLRSIKKQYNIDVCISHLEGADYINLLSKGNEKVVLCIHGSKLHDKNITGLIGYIRKSVLMPFLYNKADRIVTVSRDINQELIQGFGVKPEKITTINNFFDIDLIQKKAIEPLEEPFCSLFQNNFTFITSGRLALQKNQAPLLQVFSKLLESGYPSKLLIVGDGELRDELLTKASSLGLNISHFWEGGTFNSSADVFFLGYQANPFKFLAKANIFVFPSAWEGFPMALSEAMICGLPVVSADCPTGPREILSPNVNPLSPLHVSEFGEYGILMPMLPSGSPNQLNAIESNAIDCWASVLQDLMRQPLVRKEYSRKSFLRMQDFSKDRIVERWINLIDNI